MHYVVHFVESADRYDVKLFESIFEANFESYNLFTLFLDRSGIKLLADLVSTSSKTLPWRFPKGKHKFVYYIIGSIGAGKSTASSNLRNLITYDEWIDVRRDDMAVPEEELDDIARIEEINQWTAEQFRKKNVGVMQNTNGIHVIDRCPLDPLTFGKPSERQKKAHNLYSTITSCGRDKIQKGHIIYLDADVSDLRNRISFKHKYWSEVRLRELVEKIDEVYHGIYKTGLCTRGRTIQSVARELAKIIFLEDYNEVDVGSHLQRWSKNHT